MSVTQTQAVVISAPGQVGLQAVTLRAPGPDDVVIETVYTSISAGTERMLMAGQMPHPQLQLPVVPGYETVGRVVAAGDNVDASWIGRWVYIGGSHCYTEVNAAWGGQAATLIAPVQRTMPLDGVNPRDGVLLALTATALHGIDLLASAPGDRVLVLGQGPVGQLAARLARSGGSWVAVSDRNAARLALAEADVVIDVERQSLAEAVGAPVSAIVDATGSMAAITAALPLLADKGTILLLGYYQTLQIPYMPLFLKEARLLTAKEWAPGDLLRSRDLIASGLLNVAPLLTHSLPIAQVATAYEVALNDLDCLKLVLEWPHVNGHV